MSRMLIAVLSAMLFAAGLHAEPVKLNEAELDAVTAGSKGTIDVLTANSSLSVSAGPDSGDASKVGVHFHSDWINVWITCCEDDASITVH